MDDFARQVQTLGRQLHAVAGNRKPKLYRGLSGALLARAMDDAPLRDSLFQVVDALPQLSSNAEISAHLRAHLQGRPGQRPSAGWTGKLLALAAHPRLAWSVRLFVRRLARHFMAEESAAGLGRVLAALARVPAQASVDAVGEAVLSEDEADAYLARNLALLEILAGHGPPHLSLKLTALTPRCDPLDATGTQQRIWHRLAPLVAAAAQHGATLTVDMEQHELKPLILDLFLAAAADFPGHWQAAVALQAYLPETPADLARVHAAAHRLGRRLGVRLVKGAYWDQEAAWAAQRGWPVPTFSDKAATDAQFEQLTAWLLERCDTLHPAIASHNLRSQTVALAHARRLGLAMDGSQWEMQMLHGMAEPLRDALAAAGAPLRIYVPSGDLERGIAYLIRRLLENTASTSVLRQTYIDGQDADALLAAPVPGTAPAAPPPSPNLPLLDFSNATAREEFAAALRQLRTRLPLLSGNHPHASSKVGVGGTAIFEARNPARPDEVLGEVALVDASHADHALATAGAAFPRWAARPVSERCDCLRRAAELIVARRCELAALEVLETAKPWREADADVAEAVDFLRYYADQMEQLAGWRRSVDFPGESNRVGYAPRGPAVIIAPWNFPLAILAGMSAAALVAGNPVLLKPALPALLVAQAWHDILLAAGVPAEAAQYLPGDAVLGAALVAHAATHIVAFTGSRAVGLHILQAAHTPAPGQRHVKQVICEMGGKNAIVVDADADLDEAVAGILASAFGYSGQKCSACSRVIAVAGVYDALLARLVAAAATLAWGPPEDPACDHGPLISRAARDKALEWIEIGRQEGRLAWQGTVPQDGGWYVPPSIIADLRPTDRLVREEVFGPVLSVLPAPTFEAALVLANDSDYGLTGGVYSRYPPHLALAREHLAVGNLYLNRKTTGARVGVQPFGGIRLSGTGIQAGGPDYLKQFLWSRCVTENTQRHGMLPTANEIAPPRL